MKNILYLILVFLISCSNNTQTENETTNEKSNRTSKSGSSVMDFSFDETTRYSSFAPVKLPNTVYGFNSDREAVEALDRIMKYTGLPANFEIFAADVPNACAVIQCPDGGNCLRYLLYNQEFMIRVKDATRTDWSAISILAHEIGHHLSGHTLEAGGSRPKIELEADKFSGYILRKMNATLDQALAAMKALASDEGSSTHPPKHSRLAAITNGWKEADDEIQELLSGNNNHDNNSGNNIARVISIIASSTLEPSKHNNYYYSNLIDNDLSSPWVEGVQGYGINEWIKIELSDKIEVKGLKIVNGYNLNRNDRTGDRYNKNSRVKKAKLVFSNGQSQMIDLIDTRQEQLINIEPVITESIKFIIIDVYPGSKWDDTCLSEIKVMF